MTPEKKAELLRLCEEASDANRNLSSSSVIRLGYAARSALPDLLAENERLTESQEEYSSATDKLLTSRSSDLWAVAEERDGLKAENERLREALTETAAGLDAALSMTERPHFIPDWDWLRGIRKRAANALAGTPAEVKP